MWQMFSFGKKYLSWTIGIILISSFLGAAVSGVFAPSKDPVIVRFKTLSPIKLSDLSNKIAQLGQYEEQMSRDQALRELVEERLIDNFIDSYKLKCSEQVLEKFLAQNPIFSKENGDFDLEKFETYLSQRKVSSALFRKLTKRNLLTQVALNNICFSYSPNYLIKAVRDYQLEAKKVCLAELSFAKPVVVQEPSQEELRNIYSFYQQEFALPEERSIDYCIIQKPSVQSHNISKEEIGEYLLNNKEVYAGKNTEQVFAEVAKILIEKKVRDLEMQIYQVTEESNGSEAFLTLQNIAKQHASKILHLANVSYENLSRNAQLSAASDSIFKTPKGCLCSPAFTKNSIIICAIKDVKEAEVPVFENLQQQLTTKFITIQSKIENEKLMEAFVGKIKSMNKVSKEDFVKIAKSYGIDCSESFEISNFINYFDLKIPASILDTVLETYVQQVTPVFVDEEKCKFCSVFVESRYRKEENLVSLRQVEEKLKFNLFADLYQHLYNLEDPKIVFKTDMQR
jgi:hypothetical protein